MFSSFRLIISKTFMTLVFLGDVLNLSSLSVKSLESDGIPTGIFDFLFTVLGLETDFLTLKKVGYCTYKNMYI